MQEVLFTGLGQWDYHLHCAPGSGLILTKQKERSPSRGEVIYPFAHQLEDACRHGDQMWLLCRNQEDCYLLIHHQPPSWNKITLFPAQRGSARFLSPHQPVLVYGEREGAKANLMAQSLLKKDSPPRALCATSSPGLFAPSGDAQRMAVAHFAQPHTLWIDIFTPEGHPVCRPILETGQPRSMECILWRQWVYVLLHGPRFPMLVLLSSGSLGTPRLFPLDGISSPSLVWHQDAPHLCLQGGDGWQLRPLKDCPGPAFSWQKPEAGPVIIGP